MNGISKLNVCLCLYTILSTKIAKANVANPRYRPRSRRAGKATNAPVIPDTKVATNRALIDRLSRLAIPVPVVPSKIVTKSNVNKAIETDSIHSFLLLNPKADKTKKAKSNPRPVANVANPAPVSTVEPTSN